MSVGISIESARRLTVAVELPLLAPVESPPVRRLFAFTADELLNFAAAWQSRGSRTAIGVGRRFGLSEGEACGLADYLGLVVVLQARSTSAQAARKKAHSVELSSLRGDCEDDWQIADERREWCQDRLFEYIAAKMEHRSAIAKLAAARSRKDQQRIQSLEREVLFFGCVSIDGPGMVAELHSTAGDPVKIHKLQIAHRDLRLAYLSGGDVAKLQSTVLDLSRELILDGGWKKDPIGNGRSDRSVAERWAVRVADSRAALRKRFASEEDSAGNVSSGLDAACATALSDGASGTCVPTPKGRIADTPPEVIAMMQRLESEGMDRKSIGKSLGVGQKTIRKYLGPAPEHGATDDEIREAYAAGMSVETIYRELSVGQSRVARAVESIKRPPLQASRKVTAGQRFKILAMWRRGYPLRAIAWQVGVQDETIRKRILNGEPRWYRADKLTDGCNPSQSTVAAIKADIALGIPTMDICDTYGVTCEVVRYCRPIDIQYGLVERAERTFAVRAMNDSGYTMQEIAAEWGLFAKEVQWMTFLPTGEELIDDHWPGIWPEGDPPDAEAATEALPGTMDKMDEFIDRLALQTKVHHPDDAQMGDVVGYDVLSLHVGAQPTVSDVRYARAVKRFTQRARGLHGDRFTYEFPPGFRMVNTATVTVICPEHGRTERNAMSLLKSPYGCPKCRAK